MTPATIRPRLTLLDALAPPDQFHASVTLRTLPALIDQGNQLAGIAAEQARATQELGQAVGAGMARLADAQVAAAGFVAGAVERFRAEVSGTLDDIREEVEQARRVQEEQLAVQRESLDLQRRSLTLQQQLAKSDRLQAKLEEFVYQFGRAVERCGADGPEFPAPTRLLVLRGFLGEIREQNIGTPMIRGIEQKGRFDAALETAQRLVAELTAHPDVLAAVEWARREERRAREEEERTRREREAEEQRVQAEADRERRERDAAERRRREYEADKEKQIEMLRRRQRNIRAERQRLEAEIGRVKRKLVNGFDHWLKVRYGPLPEVVLTVLTIIAALSLAVPVYAVVTGTPAPPAVVTDGDQPTPDPAGRTPRWLAVVYYSLPRMAVPWVTFLAVFMFLQSRYERGVGDKKKYQEELDNTLNKDTLAEIAGLEEKLAAAGFDNQLAEAQREIDRLKAETWSDPAG